MAYVITQKCLGERYGACVEVCPVDCIHPGDYNGEPFMIIDPQECISCMACLPVCPIEAIVANEQDDPDAANLNMSLAAEFKNNPPVKPRPTDDPPRKPTHHLTRRL